MTVLAHSNPLPSAPQISNLQIKSARPINNKQTIWKKEKDIQAARDLWTTEVQMLQKPLTILVMWFKEINLKQCCWACLHQNLLWFPEMAAYRRPQQGQWPLVTFSSAPLHLCTPAWSGSAPQEPYAYQSTMAGLIMGFRALLLLSKHLRDPCPSEEGAFYSLEASKADYAIQGRYQMKLSSRSRDP